MNEIKNFDNIASKDVIKLLSDRNILKPTKIQSETMGTIKSGDDVIFQASTGTGKTLAYLLPILSTIDNNIKTPQVIILTPTHELASQVYRQLFYITDEINIEATLLIGGANINRQVEKLKSKPKIIVGTAGRILDLVALKKLKMHTVKTLIIDEFDRMLSPKNVENVKKVVKCTLRDTQLVMCSASTDSDTLQIAKSMCKDNLKFIEIDKNEIPDTVKHIYFTCDRRKKFELLRKFIHAGRVTKTLLFVNNEVDCDELVQKLLFHGVKADYISGKDKPQERKSKIDKFRAGKLKVLLTTDLLSRGLDIEKMYYVINYNLPEDSDIYQHRAGRVGRAGQIGFCVSFLDLKEIDKLKKIQKKLNITFNKKVLSEGKIIDC